MTIVNDTDKPVQVKVSTSTGPVKKLTKKQKKRMAIGKVGHISSWAMGRIRNHLKRQGKYPFNEDDMIQAMKELHM